MKKPYQNQKSGKDCVRQAKNEFHKKTISAYETFALNDSHKKDKETNISITSPEGVIAAKEWVDENHK